MRKIINSAKKFWCLQGFVAIIFTILAVRAIWISFICPAFMNFLIAALMAIFAYWWLTRVLAKPVPHKRHTHDFHSKRNLDL